MMEDEEAMETSVSVNVGISTTKASVYKNGHVNVKNVNNQSCKCQNFT